MRAAADTATATASIGETFAALKKRNQCAFVPFICAGDPDLESTKKALKILDDAGADVIELGVPYSDQLADGPVIQAAATRALENGATLNKVIDLVREMTPQIKAPPFGAADPLATGPSGSPSEAAFTGKIYTGDLRK